MKIEELNQEWSEGVKTYEGVCHDCGKHVKTTAKRDEDDSVTIEGGAVYKIRQGVETLLFFKCDSCFAKDHTLRNFQKCEVWSRVVGYLRPVQQYNVGKKEEYTMRKEFTNMTGR